MADNATASADNTTAAVTAPATQQVGPGKLVESAWEIQRTLQFLETERKALGKGPSGAKNPQRAAELDQQIQQYKALLQRAQSEEAETGARGRTPSAGTSK